MSNSLVVYGFFITCAWIGTAVFDYLSYAYFWQLKEYRLDRFKDFLKSKQGEEIWKDPRFLWRGIGSLTLLISPIPYIAIAVLLFDVLFLFSRQRKFRRPVVTAKSSLIVLFCFILEFFLFQIFPLNLPFILFLRFFTLSFFVFLFYIPSRLAKLLYIWRATTKIAKYKKLLVIGITGSYGKSSVKEFATHFLATDFKVIKTPKNINSEIGIAKFILKTNFTGIDFFVCEMGAYRIGEIKTICNMVKPKVGILTTIGEQHLALFGSIQNIQSAKYELLRAIPKNGLVITNADNPLCTEFLKDLKCKNIETCGVEERNHPTFLIVGNTPSTKGIEFEGIYHKQRGEMSLPILGAHQAYNVALAIMVAVNMEVDPAHIVEAGKRMPEDLQGTLKKYSYGKATIIDDSYNSNPAGFRSAIEVLSLFPSKKKRIVITRGMLELGDQSDEQHEKIAGEIAYYCDELVLITPDFVEPIKRGVGEKYHTNIQYLFDQQKLLEYVLSLKTKDCVVLLENKIPPIIREEITLPHL